MGFKRRGKEWPISNRGGQLLAWYLLTGRYQYSLHWQWWSSLITHGYTNVICHQYCLGDFGTWAGGAIKVIGYWLLLVVFVKFCDIPWRRMAFEVNDEWTQIRFFPWPETFRNHRAPQKPSQTSRDSRNPEENARQHTTHYSHLSSLTVLINR